MTHPVHRSSWLVHVRHAEYMSMVANNHGICFACGTVHTHKMSPFEKPGPTMDPSASETAGYAGGWRCKTCKQQAVDGRLAHPGRREGNGSHAVVNGVRA